MGWGGTRRRSRATVMVVVLVAAVSAAILGVWRPWVPQALDAPLLASDEVVVVAPTPLVLPENPRVLVFGDSWTYGSAASDPTLGYAYVLADLLQGETIVDGVRGSGYLKPGLDGPAFGERITALDASIAPDLVIVQGSINDRAQGAEGYRDAVTAAWDALAAKFPETAIVVLGPAPHELPVGAETARIDADLAALAGARGWWYISPVKQDWITDQNYLDVIDVDLGNKHPSTDGHRYLAEKVAAALADIEAAPVTEAGGAETTPGQ
ncbi:MULTISPECIES: SGNH/GDSL hydrolase family protein [unclassified Microbacterium]|uniref:SGNH/GDSL hydrolase family protein n=1 Tax=unclassified Microbacterium TaxID=2609290 RepID=UPI001E29094F|nr:SGNH/GDSL hydrolase family protein [Microbacterium sp. Bi121]